MVSLKLIGGFLALTFCILATAQAASTKKAVQGERVAALYVKDNSNGELRFLGTGFTSNAQINQLITQKQDMLEQMRPTGTTGTGTGTATGTGTLTGTGTGTGAGQVIAGMGGSGVIPIIINTGGNGGGAGGGGGGGGGGGAGGGGGLNGVINGASPIADLLPQIIGQAVIGGGTRRGGGVRRRRVGQKRRRNRNNRRPQIFVVRPRN